MTGACIGFSCILVGSELSSVEHQAGAFSMSRVIKLYTPKHKETNLPKTAALTKAQLEHKAWLKAHGIKVTKNTLRT
jgi:hypothetical protein